MKRIALLGLTCLALACPTLSAQEAGAPRPDPIAEHVLPPELILRHHQAIQLSEAQRTAVFAEVKRTQGRIFDVQWDLQRALERLLELLKQNRVDEQQAIAQLDQVLAAEREIKRAHVGLAVRLKNILSPEQQRMLRELRAAEPAPRK
jgi:Spy/CpxP family protein refolding chaperone